MCTRTLAHSSSMPMGVWHARTAEYGTDFRFLSSGTRIPLVKRSSGRKNHSLSQIRPAYICYTSAHVVHAPTGWECVPPPLPAASALARGSYIQCIHVYVVQYRTGTCTGIHLSAYTRTHVVCMATIHTVQRHRVGGVGRTR